MDNKDHKETVKAGYNIIADRYIATRTRDSGDVRLLDELTTRLPAAAKVLDAGCGAGLPISQMLSEKFEVTGVDFSEAQIELAKKNVPDATFICQDMTKLDFPDSTFDGICSYYAIIHIPRKEHQPLFANFYRCSSQMGWLYCVSARKM